MTKQDLIEAVAKATGLSIFSRHVANEYLRGGGSIERLSHSFNEDSWYETGEKAPWPNNNDICVEHCLSYSWIDRHTVAF